MYQNKNDYKLVLYNLESIQIAKLYWMLVKRKSNSFSTLDISTDIL